MQEFAEWLGLGPNAEQLRRLAQPLLSPISGHGLLRKKES
jgi:hypothetical protein